MRYLVQLFLVVIFLTFSSVSVCGRLYNPRLKTTVINKVHRVKILVIGLESPDEYSNNKITTSFIKQLQNISRYTFNIRGIFIRTQQLKTFSFRLAMKQIIANINNFNPDIIITLDDTSFEKFGIRLSRKYPVIACNIKQSVQFFKDKYNNLSNVYFLQSKLNFKRLWSFFRSNKVYFNKIYILLESTSTISTSTYLEFENCLQSIEPHIPVSVIRIQSISDVRSFLEYLQKSHERSNVLIILLAKHIYKHGKIVSSLNIIPILLRSSILTVSTCQKYCRKGFAICITPDFSTMGSTLASVTLMILDHKYLHKPLIIKPLTVVNITTIITVNESRLEKINFLYLLNDTQHIHTIYNTIGDHK